MNHKQKVKMARRMLTADEKSQEYGKTPIFQSIAWDERKSAIQERVANQIAGKRPKQIRRREKAKLKKANH